MVKMGVEDQTAHKKQKWNVYSKNGKQDSSLVIIYLIFLTQTSHLNK